MNAESDKMANDIENLVGQLQEIRGKKNETFYNDILTGDYVNDLYDTDPSASQKLINVKNRVIRESSSPERVISDKRQAELSSMAGRRGTSVIMQNVAFGHSENTVIKSMKMDVNLASKDPLKFIDSVLAHHKVNNRDMTIREQSEDEEEEGE